MSDLVGNPEDRFSHNEAQIKPDSHLLEIDVRVASSRTNANNKGEVLLFAVSLGTYEPRHKKTNFLVSDLVRHNPGCTVFIARSVKFWI